MTQENEKHQQSGDALLNRALAEHVVSEADLCWTLGVDRRVIDALRVKRDFPVVHLNRNSRVYLVQEVVDWLKQRAQRY